ncbi:translation initiation factor 3 subunit J [Kwoniella heveanensis BCC8398]|uniref:Eukaryotic translation initiation factor 3 subunit J n=1 Tax=Kwoniella heveanensis BCC8398 TaxID=1296120 RepID=A0A1B9H3P8_9TREE|nr:translation initiation factor 3 subunit J [Kwoniella heveanensis BCC8398]
MSDDWDIDDEPVNSGSSTPAPTALPPKAPARGKWQGEDEEDDQDDWDVSEDEKPKASAAPAAAPKKKMTLKQKLAEKEKLAAEARERGDTGADDLMETMTEQDRRRLAREREQEADLAVASDLMGDLNVEESTSQLLESILKARPSTKNDFHELSKNVFTALIKKHEANPLYPALVEQLSKDMCEALTAVQTRKVSSSLSVLGNTKQQEERDKASGKKKTTGKPKLGAVKVQAKHDTEAYDDVLDDDDFM